MAYELHYEGDAHFLLDGLFETLARDGEWRVEVQYLDGPTDAPTLVRGEVTDYANHRVSILPMGGEDYLTATGAPVVVIETEFIVDVLVP